MNYRLVGKYLGYLVWAQAIFILPSVLVSILYQEPHALFALLATAAICVAVGFLLHLLCHTDGGTMYPRESFVVAGGGWVIISLLGALPFVLSGDIPHYVDAVFETASGFTTTGASIIPNVESISHGLLFWRSFTHWLGGIGVLVFLLAVVRTKTGAGSSLALLRAESPGPQVGKIMPKTRDSVRALVGVYIGLSALNLFFLLIGGMSLFDSLCIMFGTAGTGGFGIKADSMASYSPYLQNVCTVFMAVFGVNFTLSILLVRGHWRDVVKDEELRLYLGIMFGAIALNTAALTVATGDSVLYSLHHSAFTVSSIMTTTGYATVDFDLWPEFSRALLMVLMVFGAMAGSTGGGMKTSRVLILFKSIGASMHQLLHPRSVKNVRLNGKVLDKGVVQGVHTFLAVYCGIAVVSFLLISLDGFSLETNLSAVNACFNNIGPGLGFVGPVANYNGYSYFSKIVLSLDMLLGRLEIFPILFLMSPTTWRQKT